jgi:hypothetical protein
MEPFVIERVRTALLVKPICGAARIGHPVWRASMFQNFWYIEIIPEVEFAVNCLFDGLVAHPSMFQRL